jgi:hypothetical protein
MNFDFGTAVAAAMVSAGIGSIFQFVGWMVFRRELERQDTKIAGQASQLVTLRDNNLRRIEADLGVIGKGQQDFAQRVQEQMLSEMVDREECATLRAAMATRLADGDTSFRELRDDMGLVKANVAETRAMVRLVLDNMGLHMRDAAPREPA